MPHKHRRSGQSKDSSSYELPPSVHHAPPLPVRKNMPSISNHPGPTRMRKASKKHTNSSYNEDDTPRAFARLMRFQKTGETPRSGLDDGIKRGKKRKRQQEDDNRDEVDSPMREEAPVPATSSLPQIQPGERLSSFAARVDAALPVAGLKNKGNKAFDRSIGVRGEKLTKTERKMRRMQNEWREEESRRKAKREERAEEMEEDDEWVERVELAKQLQETGAQKGKKKGKKGADEEDPWAVINKSRGDEGRQKTVTDVVQAPPKLGSVREIFKAKAEGSAGLGVEVANVPGKAGSLRRREELGQARQSIVEQYRKLRHEQ